MVKAIQVLRIHLLELEKVNELCKDFRTGTSPGLKTKMHSDNLLRMTSGGPTSNQPLHKPSLTGNTEHWVLSPSQAPKPGIRRSVV